MTPHFQGTLANICINLILSESRVIGLNHRRLQYSPSSFKFFVVGSERRTCFETQCVMTLPGHPRLLILAPIESVESAYATSYWSSIVTLVLSCPVSEILQVAWWELPHPYSTRILGLFHLDSVADVGASRSKDPKLIIPVINFELVQPICPWYSNVTDRQTDRRMTYDSNTVLALRASRGKNEVGIRESRFFVREFKRYAVSCGHVSFCQSCHSVSLSYWTMGRSSVSFRMCELWLHHLW